MICFICNDNNDIRELFGETVASIVRKVTKIDLDLEDLKNLRSSVEVGVAQQFIALHQANNQARAEIQRAVKQTHARFRRASLEHLIRVDDMLEEKIRQRIEMMHLDEFARSFGTGISTKHEIRKKLSGSRKRLRRPVR